MLLTRGWRRRTPPLRFLLLLLRLLLFPGSRKKQTGVVDHLAASSSSVNLADAHHAPFISSCCLFPCLGLQVTWHRVRAHLASVVFFFCLGSRKRKTELANWVDAHHHHAPFLSSRCLFSCLGLGQVPT